MIIQSRIVRRPTQRTVILDARVGEFRLQVALIDCDGVASPATLQRCLDEIEAIDRLKGAELDVRIVEVTDPATAEEKVIRACFEVRPATTLALCYRGEACYRAAARALGLSDAGGDASAD